MIKKIVIMIFAICQWLNAYSQQVPPQLISYPDTIFHNAVIVTLDNHELNANPGTIVNAMAVTDSVISALGTNPDILALAGPETDIVDLQGKMVLPGIVESHTHPMGKTESIAREMFGLRSSPTGFDLRMDIAATPDETMAKVARAMEILLANAEPGPDDWISIALVNVPEYGFSSSSDVATLMSARKIEDVRISKSDISEIVPDYPFMLTSGEEIFGKTGNGLTPESRPAVKQKNMWYHITVDAHGEPVTTPLVEITD